MISSDGRFVAFNSDATNLVVGDTNGRQDIFVRDRLLGTTARVSVDSLGAQGNGRSADISISAVTALTLHGTLIERSLRGEGVPVRDGRSLPVLG